MNMPSDVKRSITNADLTNKAIDAAHGVGEGEICPMCDGKGYNILEYFVGETEVELEQECPNCQRSGIIPSK